MIECFFRTPIAIATLTVATIILTLCLIVVMANEFPVLPDKLIRWSDTFSLCWKDRSIFVVLVVTTIALATGLTIVSTHKLSLLQVIVHTFTILGKLFSISLLPVQYTPIDIHNIRKMLCKQSLGISCF